jgi:peptidoglycan/LPS O-acetylase OafA/YrhL
VKKPSQGSVHLDALRGAAALLVFANHTRALYFSSVLDTPTGSTGIALASTLQPSGNEAFGQIKLASEAVVIFFVLSGYLVGGSVFRSLRLNQWSWRTYLTKRLTRLWVVLIPALLIGGILDFAGSRLFGPATAYTTPPGIGLVTTYHLASRLGPTTLLGNLFFTEGILVPFYGTNVSLWSLVNEFWYYIIFPLGLLALVSKRAVYIRALWAVVAVALLFFVGRQIAILFPLWIFGALVAVIPGNLSPRTAKLSSVLVTALLLFCMFGVRLLHMEEIKAEYLIGIMASLLIWVLVQQTSPSSSGLYRTLAGFFSQISYTLYLFHMPLAMFLSGLLNSPWHRWASTPGNLIKFLLIDALILACAYGLWRIFEANTDYVRLRVFEREARLAPQQPGR